MPLAERRWHDKHNSRKADVRNVAKFMRWHRYLRLSRDACNANDNKRQESMKMIPGALSVSAVPRDAQTGQFYD